MKRKNVVGTYMSFHTSKIWQILNEEHFIKHKAMETSNKVVCECISGHNISWREKKSVKIFRGVVFERW